MRKKIMSMCFSLIIILCLSMVLVAGQGQKIMSSIEPQKIREMAQEMTQAKIREMVQTKVFGLENALLYVENENARKRLTDNMELWQNRYNYMYDQAEGTIVNGTSMVKTRNKHMLLGLFEVQSEHVYELDDEGMIKSHKRNFWAYIFRERVHEQV